jgi:hypothetical protein
MDDHHPMGAVAGALAEIAHGQYLMVRVFDKIGMNSYQPAGAPGCLEKLAMEVERIAAAMELSNVLADTKSQTPTL